LYSRKYHRVSGVGSLASVLGVGADDLDLSRPLPYDKIPLANPGRETGLVRRGKLVEEARARGLTTRQVLLDYVTGGHRIVVGTPEQVADDLIDWADTDALTQVASGSTLSTERALDRHWRNLKVLASLPAGHHRRARAEIL
jgi:alkanesulfonate monooxygenase SsuD/methylene tetrahydromethanopterin reductase-like flavin-dependent oxidoreductase (luciferase family)